MHKLNNNEMTTCEWWAIKDTDRADATRGDLLPLKRPEVYTSRRAARIYAADYRKHKIPCCVVRVTLRYES